MVNDGGDQVVTVGEDVRLDLHHVADHPFGGKAPFLYRRRHPFDDDPAATVELHHDSKSRCESHAS
jgi:hypothetical protein